jgi:2-methylfumaryl-CoA hydratase
MSKSNIGRFFEDYSLGEVIAHAVPRTLTEGERALYHALYPARHALNSSDEFARNCGLPRAPIDDWAAFHMVFGKTVPDISLNAVAGPNLHG